MKMDTILLLHMRVLSMFFLDTMHEWVVPYIFMIIILGVCMNCIWNLHRKR